MICAIVLAAGRSQRMGTQKLLLPLAGKPMIAHTVDVLLASSVSEVVVVVGQDSEGVKTALAGRDVKYVLNEQVEAEMLTSVRCGLRATVQETTAVLVSLGDQPNIRVADITAIVDCFQQCGGPIVVPTFRGKRGHPLLIAMQFREEIDTCFDGEGLRGLLSAHASDVVELPVKSDTVLEDIDVPTDYQRAVAAADDKRGITDQQIQ